MAIDTGSKVSFNFTAYDTRTIGLNTVRTPLGNRTWSITYTDGTGAAQFQKAYVASRTLGGSSEDVDLAGVLTDAFGATITATEVKAWGVYNTDTTTLTVGGTGGANWTACLNGTVTLPAGAFMGFAAADATGWAVTATTADLLHVAGTTGKAYELIFFVD